MAMASLNNTFSSNGTFYTSSWDHRKEKWVVKDSRIPPKVLCQVQEMPRGTAKFVPRQVKVGKFLADTSAQVNIANYSIFDLLGIPEGEHDGHLRRTRVTINMIGGAIDGEVKELRLNIFETIY